MTRAFPFAAGTRAARPGRLAVAPDLLGEHPVGAFKLTIARLVGGGRPGDGPGPEVGLAEGGTAVRVVVEDGEGRAVFASPPGRAFVAAALGEYRATGRAGHLRPTETVTKRYRHQQLTGLTLGERFGRQCLTLTGRLVPDLPAWDALRRGKPPADAVVFAVRLVDVDGARLGLEVELAGPPTPSSAVTGSSRPAGGDAAAASGEQQGNALFTDLFWAQDPTARLFGFGAQFTHLDMRGRAVPILTAEQGVGRGAQPLTRYTEAFGGAGGDWWSTYAPVPGFVTTGLRGLMLRDTAPVLFDLRRPGTGSARVYAQGLSALLYAAAAPSKLLELHTRETGRMPPLPDWAHAGAVVGMQGGAEKVERVVAELEAAGAPLAAVWLQDWVGNRKVPFGTRLWWHWQRDAERYPDWHGMRERLASRGVRVLVYVNPFLAPMHERPGGRPALFDVADAAGYFVKRADGGTYLTDQGDFVAGLVDLSDPEARAWYLETLTANLLESGASGWMADFGEGLPLDAVMSNGTALEWHNRYPEEWAAFNAELRSRLALASGREARDYVTFFRSGFTRSPGRAGLFWLGDQCVTWDRFDGLASALTGLLAGGFSGFALNHGDVGGYTSTLPPLPRTVRSPELLARWGELMAFTVMLRTHEGNRPQHNVQVYSDDGTRASFARAAALHASWRELRARLMAEARATGMPVARHSWLQYPHDPVCADLAEQLFLGPDLLVAPVLREGATTVRAYLPAGSGAWRHRWTGARHEAGDGAWVEVSAPLGNPGLFDRES